MMLFAVAVQASGFNEAFDMSAKGFVRPANKVALYLNNNARLDDLQQKKEFEFISDALNNVETANAQNPVYWFVRGLHARNLASYYQGAGDASLVDGLITNKDTFYTRAMTLDKENAPHLSARAYAVMKSGLPAELKQQAIQAELALGGSGEDESYYWYLHWSNVNELQKAGRFEDADAALNKMKEELSASGHQADFDVLMKKIEGELKNKESENKKEHLLQNVEPDHQTFTEESMADVYYRYLAIILAMMAVIIIIAVLFELKRRKKKRM